MGWHRPRELSSEERHAPLPFNDSGTQANGVDCRAPAADAPARLPKPARHRRVESRAVRSRGAPRRHHRRTPSNQRARDGAGSSAPRVARDLGRARIGDGRPRRDRQGGPADDRRRGRVVCAAARVAHARRRARLLRRCRELGHVAAVPRGVRAAAVQQQRLAALPGGEREIRRRRRRRGGRGRSTDPAWTTG